MMNKDRSHLTEKILNLTLEIMYLLTGEDYIVVKLFSDDVTPNGRPHGTGEWNRIQSPIMRPSSCSLKPEGSRDKKILELTNTMIELLTGEVPIRCQDVAVYFTMDEREYLEEHKEMYKASRMEDQPPLTSLAKGETLEEYLIEPLDHDTEDSNISQDQEDSVDLKIQTGFPRLAISPNPSIPEESSSDRSYTVVPYFHHEFHSVDGSPEPPEESSLVKLHTVPTNIQPTTHSMESSPDHSHAEKASPCRSNTATNDAPVAMQVKIYTCPECGKCFPKNTALIRHLRTHTGERPYSCSECNKSFSQKANLIRHQRIHTGVKPFACPECGKCFSGKSDVARHQKVHLLKKPWTCYECCKSFLRESDFIRHQNSHRAPKQFTGTLTLVNGSCVLFSNP